jgi:hypothetical protein
LNNFAAEIWGGKDGKAGKDGGLPGLAEPEPPHLKDSPIVRQAKAHIGADVCGIMPAVIEADGDHVVAVGFLLEEVEQSINAVSVVRDERSRLPASVPDPHCPTILDL